MGKNPLTALLLTNRLPAAVDIRLTPSAVSPQPVGTTINWTASAALLATDEHG